MLLWLSYVTMILTLIIIGVIFFMPESETKPILKPMIIFNIAGIELLIDIIKLVVYDGAKPFFILIMFIICCLWVLLLTSIHHKIIRISN
jgi:hypothetical protein